MGGSEGTVRWTELRAKRKMTQGVGTLVRRVWNDGGWSGQAKPGAALTALPSTGAEDTDRSWKMKIQNIRTRFSREIEGCSSQRHCKSPQLNTAGSARGGTSVCLAVRDPRPEPQGDCSGEGEAVAVMLKHCISRCANPSPNCTAPAWAILATCFRIYQA